MQKHCHISNEPTCYWLSYSIRKLTRRIPAHLCLDGKLNRLVKVQQLLVQHTLSLWIVMGLCSPLAAEQPVDETFFVDHLFPVMRKAQCDLCHNDNGVASATSIDFPRLNASREQIVAFGYQLRDFIDRQQPDESPLVRKPTNRDEHTGGVRIIPGSEQERTLLVWVNFLARMSDDQERQATELIQRANTWRLEPLTVRRLTHSQYNNTVRDLLGDQSQPANSFPKEDFIHGFRNQLEGQGISPLQAEAYSTSAERLARAAFRGGDHRQLISNQPSSELDDAAAGKFVRQFGMKAFRRPLRPAEENNYLRIFLHEAARTGRFVDGAQLVVEAMLQSPNFLLRIERDSHEEHAQFSMASRLAYLLWDTMPSREMLQAAAENRLSTRTQVESLARQMLDDPRAILALDEFLSQWMRFDRVLGATRDRRRYRDFNNEIAAAMVEETRQLFRYLVWQDQNFMEFFSADYTFINASLAGLYELPEPAVDFQRVQYPANSGRSGVLGHGSFLVLTSKPAETSPTARGLFVRNHFLAQEIAPPPPGINSVLPEITEDKPLNNRQRLEVHLNSEACASCHRLIDPIGYGFEQYDAIGAFHEKMQLRFGGRDNPSMKELAVDTQAHIQGIANSEFSQPKQLGLMLARNETCQRCIVKQYFRYAFGREETAADEAIIEAAFTRFRDSGFRFRELIMAMVTSPLFLQSNARP